MSSERLWIALLAAVSFLAGGAGGMLVGLDMPRPAPGPFAAFEEHLATTFELDARARRNLRQALIEYHEEEDRLKAKGVAVLDEELVASGRLCADRIREWVIPRTRREDFDRMVLGEWPPSEEASDSEND